MGETVYGLLGRRLGHSWSVPIHAALGCEGYRLIELEPDALASFLARPDIGGLNVTIPYKRDVMPLCDAIDPAAEAIGSVNTIVRGADGKLTGYNTDIDGFLYMARRAGISLAGRKVVILGSGGASLTARAAARREGAREIIVISRSGPDNYENLSRHADAEILVNTTPVGMYPGNGAAPVDLDAFPHLTGVLDVIYNPRRTALLLQGSARGIPCSDGLPMLVAQAKRAEELFTGRPIPDSENERILSQLRREMTSIVLIGMPGSGKTTVGEALARLTGREAIDLDARIEEAAGCSIPEIFAAGGRVRLPGPGGRRGGGGRQTHRRHPAHRRRHRQDGRQLRRPAPERPHLPAGAGPDAAAHRGPAPVPGGGPCRHVARAGAPVPAVPGRGDRQQRHGGRHRRRHLEGIL